VLCPLCVVLYQSFLTLPISNSNARLGLAAYQLVFADNDFRVAFGTTLLLAASMTLIAVPLGAALAFLMMRTDVPGRRGLEPLILLPILMPALVLAFGYVEALGPTGILRATFKVFPWDVYSFPFLVTIAGLTHAPHAYLCVATALRGIGDDSEQAARSCGAGLWKVAFGVSLPMTTPAILLAIALVFFLGFELFGLPLVLGDAQGVLVLSTYLFKLTNQLGMLPVQPVAVVIVILVAISLPLLFIQRAIPLAGFGGLSLGAPKPSQFVPFRLGLWRVPVFLAIAAWLAATLLVPLGALALRSFTTTWGEGIALWRALTFDHYRELLEHPNVIRSIINTLGIALFGGAAATAFYTALVLAIHRWHPGWARAIYYLALLPRAMPGLAVGLALLWALLLFKPLSSLQGTLVSVWLAYTLVWLSSGTQLVSRAILEVDQQLEDIARTVGATEGRMKLDVTLPLLRDGLLADWLLIFLLFAQDYSTGIYLLESGNEVIGPLLVSLWGSGAIDLVSALSVINVVMIGIGLFVAARVGVRLHA
jgi:iron(III) transport system permease protein